MRNTSYIQAQTITTALKFALKKGGFGDNAQQKRTAHELLKALSDNGSLPGRHHQLRKMLEKGAGIEEMIKATDTSRRTIFRYLNHFEDAGIKIVIVDGKYRLE